jgi:hypothetical protein
MYKKLHKWLSGSFKCHQCGTEYNLPIFGFGEVICPDCYGGEEHFIFFNSSFFLNRIMMRLGKFDSLLTPLPMKSPYDDPAILHEISSELDVTLQESEVQ